MDRLPGRTLGVLCLVVLLGCSGLTASDTSTPTVTPAPVPSATPTPTPTPTEVAPGLTRRGFTDPDALAAAHVRSLNSDHSFLTSYTLHNSYVERYPNGTVATRVRARHTVEVPQNRHFVTWTGDVTDLFEVETTATRGRAETFCELGRCLLALTTHNTTTYRREPLFGPSLFTAISNKGLSAFLASIEHSTVGRVEHEGVPHYRVRAVGVRDPGAVPTARRVRRARNVSFSALVSPTGLPSGSR